MGATKYDWTDKTETGLAKEEFDALWTAVNAIPAAYDLDDLDDVVITSVADHELLAWDAGTAKWINMTPTEAGLDALYLLLNTSNGPLTDTLTIAHATAATLKLNDTGGNQIDLSSGGAVFATKVDSVTKMRYRVAENSFEIPLAASEPDALLTPAAAFYENTANEELWVQWKDSTPVVHHARVARAKRTIIYLAPGAATKSGATEAVIGANTDVSAIRFANGATQTAAWAFKRPTDWDYGTLNVTVWWTNYDSNVTGNHYWPQRLIGCATGEHLAATQTCATLISGAQTTAGLNDNSKIGATTIAGSAQDLTGESFMNYRIQRQGAHGSDSSSANWEVIMIQVALTTT